VISLTRLNGKQFVLNADLIRTVEERPDTTVTLINGDTLVVREDVQEVVRRAIEYGRAIRAFQA
jgi:flagellar protein FlbD